MEWQQIVSEICQGNFNSETYHTCHGSILFSLGFNYIFDKFQISNQLKSAEIKKKEMIESITKTR